MADERLYASQCNSYSAMAITTVADTRRSVTRLSVAVYIARCVLQPQVIVVVVISVQHIIVVVYLMSGVCYCVAYLRYFATLR